MVQCRAVLALDTSTDRLSVAVGQWPAEESPGGMPLRVLEHAGAGAAQSSSTLIPVVQGLLAQAGLALSGLDAIAFGAGPGSFTGLRTACAVAQGLALGAGVPVLPVDTLQAVAEDWRAGHPALPAGTTVWALLDARMEEVYVAGWRWWPAPDGTPAWQEVQPAMLAAPEQLLDVPGLQPHSLCVGNVQPVYGDRLPVQVMPALPAAAALLRLAPGLLMQQGAVDPALALPRYVRDKVAQTTAERAAAKAGAGG